jgi:hypothetical protein
MKSAALRMARAIRVTCVLTAIGDVLLFSLARPLGIVIERTSGVLDGAVGMLTTPEEEKWECLVSW